MIAAPASWSGTYSLPSSAAPVAIVVRQERDAAVVSLGPGHSEATKAAFLLHGARVNFSIPGLPQDVVFDGTLKGGTLSGTVEQGRLRGRFLLHRGVQRIVTFLGVYRGASGEGAAVAEADGLPPFIVEFPSGATYGIGPSLAVGARLEETTGNGSIAPDPTGFSWNGRHYTRLQLRQREVRVGLDAATLTLPPGSGPFPAVVMVHGSGQKTRDEFDIFTAYFALNGIAVLADDKRGVGESGGAYPGDDATTAEIDLLASDAQAEVHFLDRLPVIDAKRVGLFGDSQAGWVAPLAAARDPAVHWMLLNSGPTTTVGESDLWGQLAGESERPPNGTRSAMLAQVRAAGPSGFDPLPSLRALTIPALWMFGTDDRNIPTELCVERLQSVRAGHAFSWDVLPTTHTPLVLPTGLLSSLAQSPGFDEHFFQAVGAWLQSKGLE